MNVHAEIHLFGSVTGYQCLARSAGITDSEDEALSEFGFGQSANEEFLEGLAREPSAYARRLPSGRFAVTRVLNGPPDDHGRPTLRRLSIVVAPESYLAMRGNLRELLLDGRVWDSVVFESGLAMSVAVSPARPVSPSAAALGIIDAWRVARKTPGSGVLVGQGSGSSMDVLGAVAATEESDAIEMAWGIGLLKAIPWVDVIALSRFAILEGNRRLIPVGPDSRHEGLAPAPVADPPTRALVESMLGLRCVRVAEAERQRPWAVLGDSSNAPMASAAGDVRSRPVPWRRRSSFSVGVDVPLALGVASSTALVLLSLSIVRPSEQSLASNGASAVPDGVVNAPSSGERGVSAKVGEAGGKGAAWNDGAAVTAPAAPSQQPVIPPASQASLSRAPFGSPVEPVQFLPFEDFSKAEALPDEQSLNLLRVFAEKASQDHHGLEEQKSLIRAVRLGRTSTLSLKQSLKRLDSQLRQSKTDNARKKELLCCIGFDLAFAWHNQSKDPKSWTGKVSAQFNKNWSPADVRDAIEHVFKMDRGKGPQWAFNQLCQEHLNSTEQASNDSHLSLLYDLLAPPSLTEVPAK